MYLTFAEYQARGGTNTATAFALLEFKARKMIDSHTQGRVSKMANIPGDVKNCMFELIGKLFAEQQYGDGMITSELSSSYSYSVDVNTASQSKIGTIKTYLSGVTDDNGIYLLYTGVE